MVKKKSIRVQIKYWFAVEHEPICAAMGTTTMRMFVEGGRGSGGGWTRGAVCGTHRTSIPRTRSEPCLSLNAAERGESISRLTSPRGCAIGMSTERVPALPLFIREPFDDDAVTRLSMAARLALVSEPPRDAPGRWLTRVPAASFRDGNYGQKTRCQK